MIPAQCLTQAHSGFMSQTPVLQPSQPKLLSAHSSRPAAVTMPMPPGNFLPSFYGLQLLLQWTPDSTHTFSAAAAQYQTAFDTCIGSCCHSTTTCACRKFKLPSCVLDLFHASQTACNYGRLCRDTAGNRRISRRSSLTDDRVDEVINNLTSMHSMVKLLRESSMDKPDASRTWDVSLLPHHTQHECYHHR